MTSRMLARAQVWIAVLIVGSCMDLEGTCGQQDASQSPVREHCVTLRFVSGSGGYEWPVGYYNGTKLNHK